MLVKVEGKTVAKTVQDVEVEALVNTPSDKTQEVVAKTIAYELIRMGAKVTVKKEADTLADLPVTH